MNADSIKIECEEDGFHLIIDGDSPCEGYTAAVVDYRITDPEALYDHVKAVIGPWLYERDMARSGRLTDAGYENPRAYRAGSAFLCDPDESAGYDTSDPKHPQFHSIHADIHDSREGK